jgi:hypothetical protein
MLKFEIFISGVSFLLAVYNSKILVPFLFQGFPHSNLNLKKKMNKKTSSLKVSRSNEVRFPPIALRCALLPFAAIFLFFACFACNSCFLALSPRAHSTSLVRASLLPHFGLRSAWTRMRCDKNHFALASVSICVPSNPPESLPAQSHLAFALPQPICACFVADRRFSRRNRGAEKKRQVKKARPRDFWSRLCLQPIDSARSVRSPHVQRSTPHLNVQKRISPRGLSSACTTAFSVGSHMLSSQDAARSFPFYIPPPSRVPCSAPPLASSAVL